jgi:hypothetical protein
LAFVPLRGIGSGGIVTDQDPYDLELTQFPDGNNVLFENGRLGKAKGYVSEQSMQTHPPTHVQAWAADGNSSIVVGTQTKLFKYDGQSLTNLTKTSDATNYSNSSRWQSEQIGTGLMFNNGSDVPQYISPTDTRFADIPNWPSTLTTKCIKPYNSFLVMVGYSTSGGSHPYSVRWSDEYDPAGVPSSYDITSTTNLAGANTLSGKNGKLIDQLTLGNSQIIYAETGVFAMDFIGAPFVFSFRELFTDDGIINRGACASFMNQHLVVGNNDIYLHDGNSKKSIADKRVRDRFFNTIVNTESIFCTTMEHRSEVWIAYSDDSAPDSFSANRALVYNYAQDAWSFVDLPNVRAMTLAVSMDDPSQGDWNDLPAGLSWGEETELWSTASQTTAAEPMRVFSVSHYGQAIFRMDYSYQNTGSASFIEATKIDLDAILRTSTNSIKQINGFLPQIEGSGTVSIYVGTSNTPTGGVLWKSPVVYNIDTDHKVDLRASGRYLALRFESQSTQGNWNITGLDIDIREVAAR